MLASESKMHVLQRVAAILLCTTLLACGSSSTSTADLSDPSVAREWSEVLLEGIRNDFARPTVHSRNLFHISSAMYDAWAIFDDDASTYLLDKTLGGDFSCDFDGMKQPRDIHLAREEAISYAAYRLIRYRFRLSPGVLDTEDLADELMAKLGFDADNESLDYSDGSAAALGNYIASCYIGFGLQDGSNEAGFFANEFYEESNPPIRPTRDGNPDIVDLDRWQRIQLNQFIDQSGNPIGSNVPFLGPEWGQVESFALDDAPKATYTRDGFDYQVYYPAIAVPPPGYLTNAYKTGFSLVSVWSSHLDPADGVMIDISPASLGNPNNALPSYYPDPAAFDTYESSFYNRLAGGDPSTGYTVNPITGAPYEPQLVPRGDYTRVLAEFWADGPDSETPPGHWFTLVNAINDHPDMVKRFEGAGPELGPLEWDVKLYFTLGGAMHDVAVAAWGIKGWFDYLRPVSAIRAMADRGQSSDPGLGDSYHVDGIPLEPGLIEVITTDDDVSLKGNSNQHVNKIKVLAWRGPDYIPFDTSTEPPTPTGAAGVGWIRAENWWPYQRPTFVTPPFAGYISGHSTFSRAAAELLTEFTGSPYFPGGMSGFEVTANEFLVFEKGPSVDMVLQWATYRDASDQCSLSRIWGGIHPPADDVPGRLIGMEIGPAAFTRAKEYFNGER
jgi:hypothetical protein